MATKFVNPTENAEAGLAFQAQPELQQQLLPVATESTVAKGEYIFRQGSEQQGIYLVLEGSARLFMTDASGAEVSSRYVGKGCILGLPATLCSMPYVFNAEATEQCRIGFIAADRLNAFLRDRAMVCMQVVQIMSRELAAINATRAHMKTCINTRCALLGACQGCS